ncbi:MAG: ankyrin repeat domain-containing protein [Bdellovibrionales bacterium]
MFKFYFYLLLILFFSIACSSFKFSAEEVSEAEEVTEIEVEVAAEEEVVTEGLESFQQEVIVVVEEPKADLINMFVNKASIEEINEAILDGSDLESRDNLQATVLMRTILKKKEGISKFLIEAGADVNARDNRQTTPLMFAAQKKQVETVKLLLEAGVDVNAVDEQGYPALWYAYSGFFNTKKKREIIRILREAGAKDELMYSRFQRNLIKQK